MAGTAFCGTDEGLIILDEKNEKKLENKISSLLNKIRIRCLKVDSMDNLWIATTGSGIYKVRVDSSGEYEIKNFSQKTDFLETVLEISVNLRTEELLLPEIMELPF